MATVFSNVEADITDDLLCRFPHEFDFDAMLKKVCEDAGVVIVGQTEHGGDKTSKYRLKGLWLAMEKAYKHLVTTLALYGTRQPDTLLQQNKQMNIESGNYGSGVINEIEALNEDATDKDYNPDVQNILQDIFGDGRRTRRPRKSARQNRKIGELTELGFDEDEEFDDYVMPKCKAETETTSEVALPKKEGGEAKDKMAQSDTEQTVNGNENHNSLVEATEGERAKPKRRGRPRKSISPFHLNVKKASNKRGPYKKKTVAVPIASVSPNEKSSVRRRGRPKVYDDEGRTEFPCSDCSFIAKKRAKLRSHRLRMHLSSPIKCDVCNKVFPNKRYMLRHRASHVAPQHCCDVCGKMYKIRKAMLEHRKTHDNNYKKMKVKCEICPKSFCNRYILECHIRDIHMGQKKSYLCSTCGKSFTTKHSLAEHTNAHTGVKPHVCEHCGKSFSYESALRDHRYTHTDAKHFWCNHCQKGFSQRSGLKMHMRIHRQHKMFICSECGRGFTQKQALQRHERVHKGEKPFVCKHCGRYFTDASIIRRHLILVHKIHKDANSWREDIVCTVKIQNEYQVQKIGEDNLLLEAEKEKEDILKVVGAPPRNNKGPSRAFSRTYPRRVALLDDEGNIIAPPEVPIINPPAQLPKNNNSATSKGRSKSLEAAATSNTSLILTTENSSDIDSNSQVLNQRYVEAPQWDALAGQLTRGPTSHIEHIILDDNQHEIQHGIEHVQGLHKIIKYENLQTGVEPNAGTHTVLSHSQGSQSPSPSTVSFAFASQAPSHSRGLETSFENLNPQAAHTGNQYYDGRASGHSGASWSSMFYYSQLASQFGMSINAEYPYLGGTVSAGSPAPHLTHCAAPSSTVHQSSPSALILQTQSHNLHIESVKSEEHRSHEQANSNVMQAAGLTVSSNHNPQDLAQARLKLAVSNNADELQAQLILQQDLQEHSPSHSLNTTGEHHVTSIDQLAAGPNDAQTILVRPLVSQVLAPSRQSSPSIPPQNSMLHSLKHK